MSHSSKAGSYANMTYRLDSTLSTVGYGNNVQTSYTYDPRARPTRIQTVRGSTLLDLNYTYGGTGNVLTITDGVGAESYGYDALDRLTSTNSASKWGNITYTYDAVGNRLSKVEGGATTTYGYGSYNRLMNSTVSGTTTTYTYDSNGNLESRYDGTDTWSYTYTKDNMLKTVKRNGNFTAEYFYDGDGKRIKTIENISGSNVTTLYVYQGLNVLYEKVAEKSLDV